MNVVAVYSAKHAPGSTTLAQALACVLADGHDDDGPPVLFETDESGGDLAARLGLPVDPGLRTLAAASRHSLDPGVLWRHANSLPAGGAVVIAPTDPGSCRSSLDIVGSRLPHLAATERVDAVFDRGRLADPATDPHGSIRLGATTLLACRPDLAGLEHAGRWVRRFRETSPDARLMVVTVGDRPYGPDDVTRATGTTAWTVPWDPSGAAALTAGPSRRARRTQLVRAVRTITDRLWAGVVA